MTGPSSPPAETAAQRHGRLRLSRGITATWWYTVTAIVFLELTLLVLWTATLLEARRDLVPAAIVGLGGLVWWVSTFFLMKEYRRRTDDEPMARWRLVLAPLLITAAYSLAAGLASGLWLVGVMPLVQSLMLIGWPPGVRLRIVIAATALLAALWFVDSRLTYPVAPATGWFLLGFFSTSLPAMTVLSLWWWDVLMTVDRARASEARLAATQERLRIATDVHDLQGHHLQVIALQLELAERLMPRDPDAALEQLRAARASVDEARQGTRDLATRVRAVPLRDELANAVDLLRAAGLTVQARVDADADRAPASVLAPIIRETTTNVLRHGGGRSARLTLERAGDDWRYEIANDADGAPPSPDGSGLDGIARRVADAGGASAARRSGPDFIVEVRLPAAEGEAG